MDALIAYRQYLAAAAHLKSGCNTTASEHQQTGFLVSSIIASLSDKLSDATHPSVTEMSTPTPADDGCPVPSGVTQNQAQVYEYHNQQVIGFRIGNREMVCLPQVYELFLKQLVGGLHTVYTKLKRLDIHPVVCNVEQVSSTQTSTFANINAFIIYLICCSPRPGRPAKRFVNGSSLNPGGASDLKPKPLAPPSLTSSDTSDSAVPRIPNHSSNSERNRSTEVLNFDISQLFPFAAQHLLMEQLMSTLAARHPGLSSTASMTSDMTKSESKSEQSSKPGSQQEQPQANNSSNSSDNTYEWNVERDKTDSTSPHENSITSNDANTSSSSLPTIPGSGLTFNSSNSGSNLGSFSFDREKSTSLANNSGYSSGSSSDSPPQALEIQSFVNKFSKTVDSLEKRFLQQYEKLSALATTLQTTMEKINNREEYLLMKLHQHKERSHHYFRKYLVNRYHLALRRRNKRGKSSKEDLPHEFDL
uniref:Ski_Sno domain-containing protein n=1 Tax=Panagrellus redivivus TaxID=6233 RepID=A0A7E4W2Q0_PANRE